MIDSFHRLILTYITLVHWTQSLVLVWQIATEVLIQIVIKKSFLNSLRLMPSVAVPLPSLLGDVVIFIDKAVGPRQPIEKAFVSASGATET